MDVNKDTADFFGLEERESKIYIFLLGNDPLSISAIARGVQLKRSTTNDIVFRMVRRGLILVVSKRKRKAFTAADPLLLRKILRERLDRLERELPKLLELQTNQKRVPRILYFEGRENLKNAYRDTLTARTNIVACTSADDFYHIFGRDYAEEYVNMRLKGKIPALTFVPASAENKSFAKLDSEQMRRSKIIDPQRYPISMEINIYDDKVMLVSLRSSEPFGAIIQSLEFAKTLRSIFRLAWDNYRPRERFPH